MKNLFLIFTLVLSMLTLGLTAQDRVFYIEKGSKQFKVSAKNSNSFRWYVNGNIVPDSSSETYSQQWLAGIDYWISVAGLTSEGCIGDTFSVLVKVKDTVTIGGPQLTWVQSSPYVICYDTSTFDFERDSVKFDLLLANNPLPGKKYQFEYSLDDTIQPSILVHQNDTLIGIPAKKVAVGTHTLKLEKLKYGNELSTIVDYSSGKRPELSFSLRKIPQVDGILFSKGNGNLQTLCVNSSNVPYIADGEKNIQYLWQLSNGSNKGGKIISDPTLERIFVDWGNTTGNYSISVSGNNNGCITSKSIDVILTNGPLVSLGGDESICEGSEKWFTLEGGVYDSIRWPNNKRGTEYSTSVADTVKVKVYLNGCSAEDEAIITTVPKPILDLGLDTLSFCENQQIVLDANTTGVDYIWKIKNTDANDSTLEYSKTVRLDKGNWIVSLTVTSANVCSSYDTVVLTSCDIPFEDKNIPNFITPNKDGFNDTWVIPGISEYPNATIEIYDRWGRIVYRADKGYSKPWDGTMGSIDLPIDSYYYIINLNSTGGKYKIAKGTIVIIK